MTNNNITNAGVFIDEHNTPVSKHYDDVYFSKQNGALETDYVFINANDLLNKWLNHAHEHFCIAETGFGTGLNFFRCVQHFLSFRHIHPEHQLTTLVFISTEKQPLARDDAQSILDQWQKDDFLAGAPYSPIDIIDITTQWLLSYPEPVAGVHRRHLLSPSDKCQATIILDLYYGDAADSFSQLQQTPKGLIDAWFLDGFAPSKNNSMWTQNLYKQMAQISAPNASFATFTAAGAVKRGLQSAGFIVHKQKGYGHKREMLVGFYPKNIGIIEAFNTTTQAVTTSDCTLRKTQHAPYYTRNQALIVDGQPITIVGNGLAGAMMALKLTQRGKPVTLIWQSDEPSDGASGNPIGGFYPQLNAQHNTASQIQLHSFLYASEFYKSLNAQHPFNHDWCGALQLGFNHNTQQRLLKMDKASLWPQTIAQLVSAQQACEIANIPIPYPCLHIPRAGWIEPPSVVNACLQKAQQSGLLTLHNNLQLSGYLHTENNTIELTLKHTQSGAKQAHEAHILVLAMGSGSQAITHKVIPMRLTRGQVEMVASPSHSPEHALLDVTEQKTCEQNTLAQLNTLLCHKGYFTPMVNGFHALGSSYVKNDTAVDVRLSETDANFAMHINSIDNSLWQDQLKQARLNPSNFARAAVRCSTPDHLPVVGAMPSKTQFEELADLYKALPLYTYPVPGDEKNIFVLTGLGSRGLTTAPLMAEILVAQILGQPLPMTKVLLDALCPNRFIVRSLIRQTPWQA